MLNKNQIYNVSIFQKISSIILLFFIKKRIRHTFSSYRSTLDLVIPYSVEYEIVLRVHHPLAHECNHTLTSSPCITRALILDCISLLQADDRRTKMLQLHASKREYVVVISIITCPKNVKQINYGYKIVHFFTDKLCYAFNAGVCCISGLR